MKLIVPPAAPPPPETLTKDLIQHLSKEIETTSSNMMAFRTRIGFSLCIGPFLLLGSLMVAAKGQPVTRLSVGYLVLAVLVIAFCYLVIAYITSEIELQALEQCNNWRNLIQQICQSPSRVIGEKELEQKLKWRFKTLGREWGPVCNGVKTAYFVGYFLLFVAVVAAAIIVSAGTPEPRNGPDNGVNVRIEEVVTPNSKH